MQPVGWDAACRRLALSYLVAIDHENVGATARELARHGQTGEARAADQNIAVPVERRARVAAFGRPCWHSGKVTAAGPSYALSGYPRTELMAPTTVETPPTDENAKVVEGSDGLLLEVDGRIVPNYDATLQPFQEGDVVTGNVVRIDNDEVLVDIGYKSEGVIPSAELSIRKSVDPSEEV